METYETPRLTPIDTPESRAFLRRERAKRRWRRALMLGALVLLALAAACGTVDLVPPCKEQRPPGDSGEKSWPCPGAPGYSFGCTSSPSEAPLVDCEIDDGRVEHFRTICVAVCP